MSSLTATVLLSLGLLLLALGLTLSLARRRSPAGWILGALGAALITPSAWSLERLADLRDDLVVQVETRLRQSPAAAAPALTELAPGAVLTLNGAPHGDYTPVRTAGAHGWVLTADLEARVP